MSTAAGLGRAAECSGPDEGIAFKRIQLGLAIQLRSVSNRLCNEFFNTIGCIADSYEKRMQVSGLERHCQYSYIIALRCSCHEVEHIVKQCIHAPCCVNGVAGVQ
jgi:hypothetical protein